MVPFELPEPSAFAATTSADRLPQFSFPAADRAKAASPPGECDSRVPEGPAPSDDATVNGAAGYRVKAAPATHAAAEHTHAMHQPRLWRWETILAAWAPVSSGALGANHESAVSDISTLLPQVSPATSWTGLDEILRKSG
jgi:hypothetical protein